MSLQIILLSKYNPVWEFKSILISYSDLKKLKLKSVSNAMNETDFLLKLKIDCCKLVNVIQQYMLLLKNDHSTGTTNLVT